jgi:hypothetical protein
MKLKLIGAFLFLIVSGCANDTGSAPLPVESTTQPPDATCRQEFATRFAKITERMPANQAREILGKPDEIHTRYDPGSINLSRIEEIWRYGVDHPGGYPTLGSVAINDQGMVEYFAGTHGGDLVGRLCEREIRRLLGVLNDVKSIDSPSNNPRTVIAAVNALQPLGRETGIAVMREYLDVDFERMLGDGDSGAIMVMRLLFEPPPPSTQPATAEEENFGNVVRPGYFRAPAIMLGWTPDDPTRFPRYPAAVIDDIPMAINYGGAMGGRPESAREHLDFLVNGGAAWRKTLLHPSNDPMSVLPKLLAQVPAEEQQDSFELMMAEQLLNLVDTVYQRPHHDDQAFMCDPAEMRRVIAQATQRMQQSGARWDTRRSCYVRADGTVLPPIVVPVYRSHFFTPDFMNDPGFKMNLTVTRRSENHVELSTETTVDKKPHPLKTSIRVIQVGGAEKVLMASGDIAMSAEVDNPDETTKYSSEDFVLKTGQSLRIEITHGGQRIESPAYEP